MTVGITVTHGWQRGSWFAPAYRLHDLDITDAQIARTGARKVDDLDVWFSADTPQRKAIGHEKGRRGAGPQVGDVMRLAAGLYDILERDGF